MSKSARMPVSQTRAKAPTRTKSDNLHGQTLQTLDRGLKALAFISQHPKGVSIAELSAHLGVHRAIGYRLATTLELNGYVLRHPDGQVFLGAAILALAADYEPQLRSIAAPLLQNLADDTKAAAFISVPEGGTCVAIMVAEPDGLPLRLSYRVGSRHPLTLGAAGVAILSGRPESSDDPDTIREARRLGYSITRDQLQPGAVGVATPIPLRISGPTFEASVGVVALRGLDIERAAGLVRRCARQIVDAIRSSS